MRKTFYKGNELSFLFLVECKCLSYIVCLPLLWICVFIFFSFQCFILFHSIWKPGLVLSWPVKMCCLMRFRLCLYLKHHPHTLCFSISQCFILEEQTVSNQMMQSRLFSVSVLFFWVSDSFSPFNESIQWELLFFI